MDFERLIPRSGLLTLAVLLLSACGGSNDNASPGSIVVEVPVEGGGGSDGGGDSGSGGDTGGGSGGVSVASQIPARLSEVITDSGGTTSTAFGDRPIFTIDVAALPGGRLDPTGLVLGNDAAFEISGGALRIAPAGTSPVSVAASSGDSDPSKSVGSGGSASISQLPNCQFELAPGAVVFGSSSSDFLVIEQDCAILADGTADQPIIFTAAQDIEDTVEAGDRGLWGGLVINGSAPINDCPEGIQGGTAECTKEGEANSGTFGGADPNDNSGILRYVTVRYAGSNVDPENQLNGIAFQGVGDETVIEFVQVHNNLDDGIEFFGGTASARNIVLTGNADDSLDWTDGWTGSIQFLYIEQTDSADNAIEADNREGDEDVLPRSSPAIANMTVIGNSQENALRLRRGTGLTLYNSFVDGSSTCVRVDGTSRNLLGTDINISGVSFACAQTVTSDPDSVVQTFLETSTEVSLNGGSVTPVSPVEQFFTTESFVGAFGAENWTEGWTVPGSVSRPSQPDFGCPDGTTESSRIIDGRRVCDLSGVITQDVLLTSNNLYQLNDRVTIGGDNADSATLTIQPGTTIFGATSFDFLVVSRGSRIVANGTRTSPITLTALADLNGTADLASDRGLWGGLVINGNAPINDCPEGIQGGSSQCTKEGEANSGTFGGALPEDDSGVLRYVVVKFAGSNVDPENQLNGIAFQGVGSGTEVEFIQVHNNLDDGIEFFGGTVNAKFVVLTGNADDSLDWTDGWRGSLQFLVIDQADDSADSGIEADNREGDANVIPRSLPRIANMTINGNADQTAVRLRRGTGLTLFNSVVQGSANCLRIQDESLNQLGTGITFDGVSFDCATPVSGDDVAAIEAELDASNVSRTGNAMPPADLSGDPFFDDVPFIGAIQDENNDWTQGWTVALPDTSADFACPAGTSAVADIAGRETCQLSGTLNGDLVLTRDNFYVLDGKVTIGGDNTNPGVLYVNSGTTIIGDDPEDFLVISRGSQIRATGTRFSPVTFTSLSDVEGTADQLADRGLWGGLVINGNAPINDCPEGIAGGTVECTKEGEANSGLFGGADPNDDSGVLNFVVVKFAGSNVDPENQLNGIAFQGVGSGTDVDFIQVHNNLDDGVEFFGGTVDARHVVLSGNADDSLDWTDGWVGRLQYLHIEQASDSADNGIEADNREGDELVTPVSNPTIANVTILGNPEQTGMRLRRGTGLGLFNAIVSGSANCLRVQGESLNLLGTDIVLEGVALSCATVVEGDDVAAIQSFLDASNVTTGGSLPAPAALPTDGFFEQVDLIGSGFEDWGSGWTVNVQ